MRSWTIAALVGLAGCGSKDAARDTSDPPDADAASDGAGDVTVETDAGDFDADDGDARVAADVNDANDVADSEDAGDAADAPDAPDVPDVPDVTVGTCATDSPAGLAGCVEQARWQADLATIAVARPPGTAAWQRTQDLCADRLASYGYTVERHRYGVGTNVIGTRLGATEPDALVYVSAHYDSVPECPGADDNGSGVAGALEVARILAMKEHARTLVVACWDEEERGLIGSLAEARRLARAGKKVVAHFDFEMIGYFSDEPGTQQFPAGFELLFAEQAAAVQADGGQGDFITDIGGDDARVAMAALEKYGRAVDLETVTLELPEAMRASPLLADLRRSDHAAFWAMGYPAIMITDSANFRNAAYHCFGAEDAIARLDPVRAAKVVQATVGAAAEALDVGGGTPVAGKPLACDVRAQDCPADRKCSIVDDGSGLIVDACVPRAATTVAEGEVCTRGPGGIGDDDCAAGLFCTFFGLPESSPQERRCRPLCNTTADCGEERRCVHWHGAVLDAGLCLPTCDPFTDTCGDGLACRLEWVDVTSHTLVPSCDWVGPTAAGRSCASAPCAKGLACVHDEVGQPVCRALCDDAHPCASGTCHPVFAAADGLGSCGP